MYCVIKCIVQGKTQICVIRLAQL